MFPAVAIGNGVLEAKKWAACGNRLATTTFPNLTLRDVIDLTTERFALPLQHMTFSPLGSKDHRAKAAIADLYNGAKEPGRPITRQRRSVTRVLEKSGEWPY